VTRSTRIAIFALSGFLAGLLAALLVVLVLTRTRFGQEQVRVFAVRKLAEQIEGQLEVERITSRGLLGGLTLHNLQITGPPPQQSQFVRLDSARVRYNWRALLSGQIQLSDVRLYHPRVVLEQMPGDTAWNYEFIFPDRTPGESGPRKLVEFRSVRVYDGFVTLRQPLDDHEPTTAADTARSIIQQTPRGPVRVMHFDNVSAHLPRVLWETPREKGRLIEVKALSGLAYIWKQPVRIKELAGRVVLRDTTIASDSRGVISFDLQPVAFGNSEAELLGRVVQEEGRNVVDISITGKKLVFEDLLWLYPKLPERGQAELLLRIVSQPKGTLFYASNAQIEAPGTRLSGNFGIVTGDTMYFTDVDLRASPLNLELLEGILPRKLPVEGLMVGTVELKGPISQLDTKGDLRIRPPNAGPESWLKWEGVFNASDQFAASNFKADVGNLDLAVLNALRPELNLKGYVHGHIEGEGGVTRDFRFAADLHHELAGLASRYEGAGTYSSASRQLDLRLNALPLSFEQLASAYPALQKLRGEARGPISVRGPTDNLSVEARLATVGGELDFKGVLQQRDGRRRYSGTTRLNGYQLDRLVPALPATNLTGNVQFDLTAASADDANGTVSARLDRARVAGTSLSDVTLATRLRDGVLLLDTLRGTSVLGQLEGRGDFGIATGRRGTMNFTMRTDSIVLADEANAVSGGQLDGRATIRGGLSGFDLDADATVLRALFERASARSLAVHVRGRALATDSGSVRVELAADSTDIYGERLDTLSTQLIYSRKNGTLNFAAGNAERGYRLNGNVRTDSNGITLAVREAEGGLRTTPWLLQSPFAVRFSATGLQTDSFAFHQSGGAGSAAGRGRLAWARSREDSVGAARQPLDFRLALQRVPLNEYLRLFRTRMPTDGSFDANVVVGGTAGEPVIQADAVFTDLRYGDARFDRVSGAFAYSGHRIDARVRGHHAGNELLVGEGLIPIDLGFVPLRERKLNQPLEFSIRADGLPASVVTGMVGGFQDVAGTVSGTLDLRGTTRDPTIAGLLNLRNGAATLEASGVRYRNVEGTFNVLNDSVVAIDASARAGEGRATLKGNMIFAPLGNPSFDNLVIDASNFAAARRRDAEFTISGRLGLKGRFRTPELSGEITVDRGALYLDELYRQSQIVQLDPNRPNFFNVVDTTLISVKRILPATSNPFVRNLVVNNLAINVGRETWLRSRNLNVEVAGRLLVALDRVDAQGGRSMQDIRLAGQLNAIRGTYQLESRAFTARRFQIREGTVDFPGTPGLDPNLAITTVYRARPMQGEPIEILAVVSGSLLAPRIRLASDQDPPISESDLASYLFFGVPTSALSQAQSRSLDEISGRVGGALGFGLNYASTSTLGYLAEGLQSFAQDYNLLDYVSLTSAQGGGLTQNQSGFASLFANTRLEIGRYILPPDLFVVYSQRLASSSSGIGVRLEWRFHPTYTLDVFTEDRFARGHSIGIENSADFRRVYGFFLFREWSY
jgi:hypothetical protein